MAGCGTIVNKSRSNKQLGFVPFDDNHIQYEGRIEHKTDAAYLYWPGSTVRIKFNGTAIKVLLKDFNGQNYFNVIIDGVVVKKIRIDSVKKMYLLADSLEPGVHTIALFKRTQINKDYNRGYTKFFGFQIVGDGFVLSAPARKKRKMEFYGNSITCGHAIEDTTGTDSGQSFFENNYLSYAAITARNFKAQYYCIAESGIGLMAGFRKEIMPEIYNRTNPFDSLSSWNFDIYTPDVVVVNLLQNDEAVFKQPQSDAFKRRFGNRMPAEQQIVRSYQAFIQKIRSHYPKAYIICVLGNMNITQAGSPWPGYVNRAVADMNDRKVLTHFFPYKGAPKHPLIKDHELMAASLTDFIRANIKWQ
ncbi:MAG: hypothetical protein BGN92_10905 [Sphingobacteriales bacterium 41-5]|nr:MAG: hypothetical protein BGN92_10905 [Sphingobacteriales bacterium 41-5]